MFVLYSWLGRDRPAEQPGSMLVFLLRNLSGMQAKLPVTAFLFQRRGF